MIIFAVTGYHVGGQVSIKATEFEPGGLLTFTTMTSIFSGLMGEGARATELT